MEKTSRNIFAKLFHRQRKQRGESNDALVDSGLAGLVWICRSPDWRGLTGHGFCKSFSQSEEETIGLSPLPKLG